MDYDVKKRYPFPENGAWAEADTLAAQYARTGAKEDLDTLTRTYLMPYAEVIAWRLINGSVVFDTVHGKRLMSLRSLRRLTSIVEAAQDLTQEGGEAALPKLQEYDPSKGSFTTFVTPYFVKRMTEYAQSAYPAVYVPIEREIEIRRVQRNRKKAAAKGLTIPLEPTSAAYIDAIQAVRLNTNMLSLSAPCSPDSRKRTYEDTIADDHALSSPDAVDFLGNAHLHQAIQTLPKRKRDIILDHFGFNGEEQTLESIGQELHVTRERVRQVEAEALQDIKYELRSEDYL